MTLHAPERLPLPPFRIWLVLATWLFFLPLSGLAAQPADVQALMETLGQVQRVEVRYQETVESGLIDTAISTRGTLVYEAPDRIRRLSDQNEGFLLDGDRLQLIVDGRIVDELQISDIAPLEAMVSALRATLSGDLDTLRTRYRLDYHPGEADWILDLTPGNSGLSAPFRRMEIVGNGASITRIVMDAPDGDRRTLSMQLMAHKPASRD